VDAGLEKLLHRYDSHISSPFLLSGFKQRQV